MKILYVFCLLPFVLPFVSSAAAGEDGTAVPQLASPSKVSKPLFTRHGMVYSAEVSRIKPEFGNEVRANQPRYTEKIEGRDVPVNSIWAEIVMRPHPGRSVTRFDYVLVTPSGEYPCLAIAKNDDAYSQLKECWTIPGEKLRERDFVRFLYALPPSDAPEDEALATFSWKLNISSTKLPTPEIKFRVLPKELPFSKVAQQPAAGSVGLTWEELHPAPLTESAASAEAAGDSASGENKEAADAVSAEKQAPEAAAEAK